MENQEATILIEKKQALIQDFLSGKETNFLETLTSYLDEYFYSLFEKSIAARKMVVSGNPFAIIALGGYGRKEQCIHSDIDLLILFDHKIPTEVEAFVQELLYPLWDARFEVGYAVRTIDECIEMSFERFDILTTVLDARFLCGGSLIYFDFLEKFRARLATKHIKKIMAYLMDQGKKRLEDFGDSTYLVAPDLKSGFGGLRDYHTLLWYAKIKSNIKTRRDLEYYGFLSHFEFDALENALNYIWDIRNRLHYITGRKCDTLHFEYQKEVAELLPGGKNGFGLDVEAFLGELHGKMEFIKQMNQITLEDIMSSSRTQQEKAVSRPAKTEGLIIQKHRLNFANTVVVMQNPSLLLRIFLESGRTRIPLSIEAMRVVFEFRHLVDDEVRRDPACVKIFKRILAMSFWEFNVLNVMLSSGILEEFIPEFKQVKDKIQYNHYHLFPVDKHSIRCVQVINSFKDPGESSINQLYSEVFREVRNKNVLLISALLHDIGKSDPAKEHSIRGAKIAVKIMNRLGFSKTEIDDAHFLIRHHLLIAKTATRRDISDEETAVYLANKVGKIRLLRMLFLLTVADSKATGPKAWNDWTENLVKDLFIKAITIIRTGELASKKTQRIIDKKKKDVLALLRESWREEEVTDLLNSMSRRYLLYVPPKTIVDHVNLHRNLGDKDFSWQISTEEDSDIRTVSICGKDRPGFYSKIAGVFFLNNIDIIASQAYSLGDSHILDIFKVKPPRDKIFEREKWEKTEKDLLQALEDDHFLDTALDKIPRDLTVSSGIAPEPNQVRIDNNTSSFFTIVEVLTYDFPGLLFAVTNALYRSGVNVNVAMVGSKVDQVIDIFYVRNMTGDQKIEKDEELKGIEKTIMSSLPNIHAKEVRNEKN